MHVDVMTTPLPLTKTADHAKQAQNAGFSGLLFTEAGRTAYLNVG
ncbi:MAG: LLM class F420-dependent oxidoreductase, partial [Ilumatobacteraceae bacterium]